MANDGVNGSTTTRKTIVVVGLGMVGIAFIEKILNLDEAGHYRIITCGEEVHLAYNRVALTDYFQHRNVEKLYLNPPEWYTQQHPDRFVYHIGETVTSVNHEAHTVSTDKGRTVAYDYCVLATGSDASLPRFVDPSVEGVFVYRNISDLNRLLAYSEKLQETKKVTATVIGGGLLGLEAAKALYDLESVSKVRLVLRGSYPLSRQLDDMGGEIVLRRIHAMGVEVLTNMSTKRFITTSISGSDTLTGLETVDGVTFPTDIVILAIGITPRDSLAHSSGIQCVGGPRPHGVLVDDELRTSAPDVYAIGECASWNGHTYGLIAPGIEMADILAFNMTQLSTAVGAFKPRQMNPPDLSTKLKLMGVDVASFGDFFAEKRRYLTRPPEAPAAEVTSSWRNSVSTEEKTKRRDVSTQRKRRGLSRKRGEGSIETLTYRDPFAGVYKKYIFTADGKHLLGGMMVGDTSDYIKLVDLVRKKKALELPPSQFILGNKSKEDDVGELDDDTQICSCHNVSKGQLAQCIKSGVDTLDKLKAKTKAGTGCGGCMPLVTSIFKAEMKKAGHQLNTNLCPHFAMSRTDLFNVIKIKHLKAFPEIMTTVGVAPDAVGCEICKPAVASILSSLYNEHIMMPVHHANQDTNDRFLANIQRNGTFSVVPRIPAGEITPEKLVVLGQVAKKYGLYTKITGAQRIDFFGAEKPDLPSIWKELVDAGFESGHAYGKALRAVKSCVGSSWCRYGIGDSVSMAIQLEERYRGIRSPHKFKGGVSGCVRECAEAQGKDFGLIATDKGWNVYVCGNAGATPKHGTLFAVDVPPSKVLRVVDRFLMYYIRTADKLMRTARWLESMEGGIEKLQKVLLEDSLGICDDLEREMDELVGTYQDEWKAVVNDPIRQKQFRQFVNTEERQVQIEPMSERGQVRPADWVKESDPIHLRSSSIATPKSEWQWRKLAKISDMSPTNDGTTSVAVRYGDSQLAIFHVPRRGYFATQQMCPHKRAFVLEHGIVGDDPNSGSVYVSCPMHKRNFTLDTGDCLNDDNYSILSFEVKVEDEDVMVLLPETEALDAVIGTQRWMTRRNAAKPIGNGDVEIVGPRDAVTPPSDAGCAMGGCNDSRLEW